MVAKSEREEETVRAGLLYVSRSSEAVIRSAVSA